MVKADRSTLTLRESEARSAAMLDTALDSVISMDHKGRIVDFNPAAERTFGYRRQEVIGKTLAERIIPPSLRESHRRGLARYLETGEGLVLGRRIELTGLRKDGTEFPVELAITRIASDGAQKFTGYLRDISERRKAQETSLRLAAIIDGSDDAIIGKDLDGTITTWNAAAALMYGYTADEAVGRPISILVPPDRRAELDGIMARLRNGEQINPFETVRHRKDGTRLAVSLAISPLRDAEGTTIRSLVNRPRPQ